MCHGQQLDCMSISGNGHQFIDGEFCADCKDSHYAMDDHKPCTMF